MFYRGNFLSLGEHLLIPPKIMKRILLLLFVLWGGAILVEAQKTICNPLDLSYGCGGKDANKPYRECADPVIVTFKGKYYLFTTQDRGGYRMSDDLIHWKDMEFSENVRKDAIADGTHYVAPAAAALPTAVIFQWTVMPTAPTSCSTA